MVNARSFTLNEVLASDTVPEDQKLQLLGEFKGHVKKELVDETSIHEYFASLCEQMGSSVNSEKIYLLCHSSLCYLVKRVAMQSPASFDKDTVRNLIIPLLRTVHSGSKVWLGSVKALEAVYLAQPTLLEETLETLQLQEGDRVATLLFIDELVQLHQKNNRNPLELLNKFTYLFLGILNEPEGTRFQDYELIRDILSKYYTAQSMSDLARRIRNPEIRSLLDVKPALPLDQISVDTDRALSPSASDFDIKAELDILLKDQTPIALPTPPKYYSDQEALQKDLEQIAIPFNSHKETEHNWRQRQNSIVLLRGIVAGNACTEYAEDFVGFFKEFQLMDCVAKAVSSLRTSLSMHGCHLVKEMATRLQEKINPIGDGLFQSLKAVLSATKKIASQNAFYAACVLLASMHFHSKTFQSCFMLSKDKNVSPRYFSSIFLRLFLVRFHSKLDHSLVYIEEWINRGSTDAQTKVRESMRVTFWYYFRSYPRNARKLLDGFQPQIRRATETSIPKHLDIHYTISHANSSESSRRSSLAPSRTPSYAEPTHSSHVQRLGALRSSSDYHFSGRHRSMHSDSRKASNLSDTTSKITAKNNNLSNNIPKSSMEHEQQIDLTGEITQGHSNTLIKKYMQDTHVQVLPSKHSKKELDEIIRNLSSDNPTDITYGAQVLHNIWLIEAPKDVQKLQSAVSFALKRNPFSLADLLRLPTFLNIMNKPEMIEACGINQLPVDIILKHFKGCDLLLPLNELFDNLFPSEEQLSLYYAKYRRRILDFSFTLLKTILKGSMSWVDLAGRHKETIAGKLLNLYGNDFDLVEYFDLLFVLFTCSREEFKKQLDSSPVYFQLKVAREFEKRDPQLDFNLGASQKSTVFLNPDQERHYMELTMVNPLITRQRSSSGSSVLVHDLENCRDGSLETSEAASENDQLEDAQGFTKFGGLSKLTEMTRVVSLYEHSKENCESANSPLNSPSLDTEGDYRMEIGLAGIKNRATGVDLSDIFNPEGQKHKDHTVKFVDNPLIIQRPLTSSSDENSRPENREALQSSLSMSNTATTDTDGAERFDERATAYSPVLEPAQGAESLSETTANGQDDAGYLQNGGNKETAYNILEAFSESTALEFELTVAALSQGVPYSLKNVLTIIGKIKEGSFKIKDLSLLLHFLIAGGNDQSLVEWLQHEGGLQDLLDIQSILLHSIVDAADFPRALAIRSLLLFSSLTEIELTIHGEGQSCQSAEYTWGCLLAVVYQMETFDNDGFLLCEELGVYMVSKGLSDEPLLKTLLTGLEMAEHDHKLVKNTFLLSSVRQICSLPVPYMNSTLLEHICTQALKFISYEPTELRKEATELLGILSIHPVWTKGLPSRIVDQMSRERYSLVISFGATNNA
ncbi:LADA_0D02234g1_1 [Lachancea dasiensis]|uniref:Protein STU1 n=1 Tax=Lachancea dasiensis TaxID=1072105 RepID=A0A1G4J4X0_9SACH|nr:LADA_0D02234g1_1 [Lachancea dasiensis]